MREVRPALEKAGDVMSASGLEVFDKTLQTTNLWLNDLMEELGPDRQVAWRALGAVLHVLRDRLTVEQAAHLAAQLPLLVRGLYYDQWRPAGKPEKISTRSEFVDRIAAGLADIRPVNPESATRAVLKSLPRHIDAGECEKLIQELPKDIRNLWRTELGQAGAAAPSRA
jgi:uncharacterized protein (DUF2267 family)